MLNRLTYASLVVEAESDDSGVWHGTWNGGGKYLAKAVAEEYAKKINEGANESKPTATDEKDLSSIRCQRDSKSPGNGRRDHEVL